MLTLNHMLTNSNVLGVKYKACAIVVFNLTVLSSIFSIGSAFIGIKIYSNLICYLLCILPIVLILINSRISTFRMPKQIVWLFFLIGLILLSISYSSSRIASAVKYGNIIYSVAIPIIIIAVTFIPLNKKERILSIRKYYHYGLIFSMVLIPILFILHSIGFNEYDGDRAFIKGLNNPIWAARYYELLLLFPLYQILENKKKKFVLITTIIIGVYLILTTGSRAPLLSLVCATYFIIIPKLSFKKKILLVLLSLLLAGIYYISSSRFESGAADYSNKARLALILNAIDSKTDFFNGEGLGSFSIITTGEDVLYYPHNVFLEIYFEQGILGIIIFLILLFNIRHIHLKFIFLLLLAYFINSLFSGDISGNNMFYIFAEINLIIFYKNINNQCIH